MCLVSFLLPCLSPFGRTRVRAVSHRNPRLHSLGQISCLLHGKAESLTAKIHGSGLMVHVTRVCVRGLLLGHFWQRSSSKKSNMSSHPKVGLAWCVGTPAALKVTIAMAAATVSVLCTRTDAPSTFD